MRFGLRVQLQLRSNGVFSFQRHCCTAPHQHPPLSSLPPLPSPGQILQTHAQLITLGLATRRAPMSHLLAHCALSPSLPPSYPITIFNLIDIPNLFATNNLLRCLSRSPHPEKSLLFYAQLRRQAMPTNNYTYPFLLHACSRNPVLSEGQQVHSHVVKLGLDSDLFVRNSLIHFYSACCEMELSKRVFDECPSERDVVSWNAMLAGYAKSGRVDIAEKLFDIMPERDVISWSSMIMGYVQNGILEKGLEVFRLMIDKGLMVNEATLVTVLSASAQLGLLEYGRFIHNTIKDLRFPMSVALGTALVDMYAKCGCIDISREVFNELPERDVFAWNAMICGLATHGLGKEALELFEKFTREGLCPASVTFVGVLNACSRAGLVAEARLYFEAMVKDYGIEPEMEHYGCMVDLLGRAGLVSEALELIEGMKIAPDPVLWGTLLGACKMHGLVDLGITIGKKLIELEPGHDGHYVLLAGIYAKARKWEDVIAVRKLMSNRGTNKVAGWSLIEANGKVHRFVAGDREHEQSISILKMLEVINQRLAEAGYMPDVAPILHDIGDEEKVHVIKEHSERLAIAFGLLVIELGSPIRIVKNLRVCGDCHEFSKMVSKVFEREIIVRDGSRFHHFKEGKCSCSDYW
ncbi:putative tetratricopeptide-like helical domain superfamily, DYW domain-containing protein [Dioscorea sansibarensis]